MKNCMDTPYRDLQDRLDELAASGNLRALPHAEPDGRYIVREGRRMLNLASNDYLGLAADTELRTSFLRGLPPEELVPSSSSSRLLTGNHPVYDELEETLAALYGAESALAFNSGYDANSGILPAVADSGTLILADKLVHASLIDGMRLSQGRWLRFRHNDMGHLESLLRKHAAGHRRIVIVTESIFSMDGDEAPLPDLVRLKRQYPQALLYVDEAHAFGLRGPQGLGCCEERGLTADVDLLVGTLGKAAASAGAFVICRRTMRDYLVNHVRPFIFTTALPPAVVAWTLHVVRQLPAMGERRRRLADIVRRIHEALPGGGTGETTQSHIIPLPVGASDEAVRQAVQMQRLGYYVLPVRPPTVPEGTARLRLSLRADLTDEEVDGLADVLTRGSLADI